MKMKRSYSYCSLCLLALAPPIARAKIPIRDGSSSSSNGASISSQFTKRAQNKREEVSAPPSDASSSSSAEKKFFSASNPSHYPRASLVEPSSLKEDNDQEAEEVSSASASQHGSHSQSSASVSVGGGTGGVISLIQHALSNSAAPILRSVSLGAQLAIAVLLAKSTWSIMKEVWDEVNEEFATARGGGKGIGAGDVREEQDMPYADENALSGGLGEVDRGQSSDDGSDIDADNRPRQARPFRNEGPQMTATRELAARLHSAGIPYESELPNGEDESYHTTNLSVEGIVRSLTKAEGNVLQQTLLTPLDGGLPHGGSDAESSAAAAAAAWNAIGGLSDAKESLLDLAFPLLPTQSDSEKNSYYGGLLANPPGVLLFGPPGCGKTMLVRALATTVGARFLAVSPSCLLRKYVGETNINVRALFSVARKISPCVIFVDELDGLFRERGGEDHDVGRDLKTEFLQLWDGIRHYAQSGGGGSSSVLVIGATNRPFDVDPAFLRRMPRRVFVGLPDHDSRASVLEGMLNNVPLDPNFDVDLVASKTGGYSPSDIREALQAAALYPLREARAQAISSSQTDTGDGGNESNISSRIAVPPLRSLRTDDVLRALEYAKPTHFSRRYQRELMNYVRSSGASYQHDSPTRTPSVTENDTNDDYFIADAGTFSGEYIDEDNAEDSDAYSYDESSDSDYDDL